MPAGSVGQIKLPIVSTFDPQGVNAAKKGLQDLQTAGGAPGGRAPKQTAGDQPRTWNQTIRDLAGTLGLGGTGTQITRFMANPGTLALGIFAGAQKMAVDARAVRLETEKLGVSVRYYRDLAWNARAAGISLHEAAAGVAKLNATANEAMGGDIGAQAYFAALGISPEQLRSMAGDSGAIARLTAQRGTAAQQIQGFGSLAAAQAAGGKSSPFALSPAANEALESTNLKIQELPGKAMDAANWVIGQAAFNARASFRSMFSLTNPVTVIGQMHDEAEAEEQRKINARAQAAAAERGTKRGAGLLSPHEQYIYEAQNEPNFDYSQIAALVGVSPETMQRRSQTERMGRRLAAVSQYLSPRELAAAQSEILGRQGAEGTLTAGHAGRGIGDTLTDYAESITRSGGLAGAYGTTTVAGYGQMVGAEFGMAQSSETHRMVELLVQIAENTGKLSHQQAEDVRQSLGYRTLDPITGPF